MKKLLITVAIIVVAILAVIFITTKKSEDAPVNPDYVINGVVTEILDGQLLVEGTLGEDEYTGLLNFNEDVEFTNAEGVSIDSKTVIVGDEVQAVTQGIQTNSLPPQTPVVSVMVK